jgi:tetratricopeptide (TPR) repeat protein
MNTPELITRVLTQSAISLLWQKAQASGEEIDVSKIKLFKYIQRDVDNDGQEELCFAAGIPDSILPQEVGVWLIDSAKNGDTTSSTFIELASPSASGFRDLQVIDINNDSIPEILSLWQIGSGQFLSLYIYQWDGKTRSSLFPDEKSFPQGCFELKDIDADSVDEIIIWEQIWTEGEKYDPKRFSLHVFRFHECVYELYETHESERLYDLRNIVSRDIGLMGIPVHFKLRTTSMEENRQRYEYLVQIGQVNEQFIYELAKQQKVLCNERFYQDSVEVADLLIEALSYLSDPFKKAEAAVYIWNLRGAACSELGEYTQAAASYRHALAFWIDDLYQSPAVCHLPGLQRQLAFMYARMDDFEHALTILSDAQRVLATLDTTSFENKEELSMLHSAFGIIYIWLGTIPLAISHFERAIDLDKELQRPFALTLNYTQLGNSKRTLGHYTEAMNAYQSALKVLDNVSEREREADIYLEMGLMLIMTTQYEESVSYLQRALLLTTVGNLHAHGAVHYLYLGMAYHGIGDGERAQRFLNKALYFAKKLNIPETQWQALYRLALVLEQKGQWQEAQKKLLESIDIIEQLRTQYIPTTLKIGFFSDEKQKVYEAMIALLHSFWLSQTPTKDVISSVESAFNYVERAKSRIFIEELSTTATSNTKNLSQVLVAQELALMHTLKNLKLQSQATANEQRYEWGDQISQIEHRLELLWKEFALQGPEGVEYVDFRKALPLTFTHVKRILQ